MVEFIRQKVDQDEEYQVDPVIRDLAIEVEKNAGANKFLELHVWYLQI